MNTEVFYLFEKKNIEKIYIKDHSNFEKKGKDIVCSAISSIINGTMNYLEENYKDYVNFQINKKNTSILFEIKLEKKNDLLQENIKMMIYQLKNVEIYYPKYLKTSKITNKNNWERNLKKK